MNAKVRVGDFSRWGFLGSDAESAIVLSGNTTHVLEDVTPELAQALAAAEDAGVLEVVQASADCREAMKGAVESQADGERFNEQVQELRHAYWDATGGLLGGESLDMLARTESGEDEPDESAVPAFFAEQVEKVRAGGDVKAAKRAISAAVAKGDW